jgi:hypothetical protein
VKLVRGRGEARWLPSRHNFALFRLAAYLRLRNAPPEPGDVILVVDRHQSAAETWLVMSWVTLTLACYLAATLFAEWHPALALPVSLPLAIALLEVPALVSALTIAPLWRAVRGNDANGIGVNGVVVMTLFAAASAWFATHPTQPAWIRFVAWQFLALLLLNAIAALIVFSLRDAIARLESAVGGGPSDQ